MLDSAHVDERLGKFKLPKQVSRYAWLLKSERLTPDSEAYLLMSKDRFFVLYVEDYVLDLDYIKQIVQKWFESSVIKFIEPKVTEKFRNLSGSQFYVGPDEKVADAWAKFAIEETSDFAFLLEIRPAKTNESYWAMTRLSKPQKISAEEQSHLDKHAKKYPPPNTDDDFLTSWKKRNAK